MTEVEMQSSESLVTPITGITYLEAMSYCAQTGSIGILRELINELEDAGTLSPRFAHFVSYCERASDFERRFGSRTLLDLSHPGFASLTNNGVISPDKVLAIKEKQRKISEDPCQGKLADALRSEGRLLN